MMALLSARFWLSKLPMSSCLHECELFGVCPAGEAPRWVYFFLGFSVFTYLHMDCIDGKQARRTKSSSPLGQLFDHGDRVSL